MKAFKTSKGLMALFVAVVYLVGIAPNLFAQSAQSPSGRTRPVKPPVFTVPKTPVVIPQQQQSCPEINALAPSTVTQGTSVTMTLTGTNLDKIKSINLGAGVTAESLKILNPASAQIYVTAAPTAPTGTHVLMVDSGPAAIGVTAAGCGVREARPRLQVLPRSTEITGEIVALAPDIVSIEPVALNRGQSATLILKTKNVSEKMGLDFGSGIEITNPLFRTGDVTFTVGVKVSADAPLGKHTVIINKTKTATALVTVNQAQPAVPPTSPKPLPSKPFTINTVVPDLWVQSVSYKITLNGAGFVNNMEVDFGEGVKQKGKIIVVNDAIAQAEVEITSDKMSPQLMGERHPKARLNQSATWQAQPATVTIYPLTKTTSGQAPPPKGKINLLEPSKIGQTSGEFGNYYGAPLLHEGLVFKWEEKTPGVQAEYFELRILSKDGNKVIKRAIAPYTTYTVPEEFIYELMMKDLAPATAQAASGVGVKKANVKAVKMAQQGQAQQGQSQQGPSQQTSPSYPAETQLLWEVAGYKVMTVSIDTVAPYTGLLSPDRISHILSGGSSGDTKQLSGTLQVPLDVSGGSADPKKSPMSLQIVKSDADIKAVADMLKKEPVKKTVQVALEVEISNRWPLSMPDRPTGLACPAATGISKGSPNTIAFNPVGDKCVIDKETRKCKLDKNGNKIVDQSNYPGDRFRIGGKFAIDKAPYEIENENGTIYNLVVDWGDPYPSDTPSTVTNMKVKIDKKKHSSAADGPAYGDEFTYTYTIPDLEHTYHHWGSFPVRIYLLPDNKIQSTDPSLVTHAFDEAQGSAQSPFRKISARAAEYMNKTAATNNKKALDVGKYAYMIYCKVVDIREVEDWDANGPLHLEKLDVTGFPGHEPGKAGECMKGQQNPYAVKSSAAIGALGAKKGPSSAAATLKSSIGLSGVVKNTPKTSSSGEQYSCDSPFTVCGVATDCDDSLIGEGRIASYYGRGYAGVRWKRNDVVVRYAEHFVKESPSRQNLDRDPAKWPPIIKGSDDTIPNSGNLLKKDKNYGLYNVRVEAMALPKPAPGAFEKMVEKAIDNKKLAASVTTYLSSSSKGGKAVKLGYLAPNKTSSSNTPPVVYVNSYLQSTAAKSSVQAVNLDTAGDSGLPAEVTSLGKVYKIVESDPNQLCRIKFPSQNNELFSISGLQNNYVKSGNNYSGCGTMTLKMNRMVGTAPEELPVVIKFQNWQIPDGINVSSGDLDAALQKPVKVPGASGTLDKITGKASGGKAVGNGVEATLSVVVSDSLRMQGVEKPQEWKGLKAPISVDGDWYLEKQTLKPTFIGWSAFKIQSDNNVTFDFSKKKTPGAVSASCKSGGGNNPGWMGIHLGNGATLIPYTFEQVGKGGWQAPKVSDWAIEDEGVCGKVKTAAFDADLYDGSIHVDSIEAESKAGVFDTTYKGMIARFPWINTELKGDSKLHWQGGGEKGLFFNLVGESPVLDYNVVKMQVKNLIFTQEENIGWTSRGDAQFNFFADGKPFDGFAVAKVFYDFAGKAYFAKGVTTGSMSRSGSTRLSKTPLNLTNVAFDTAASGDNRFKFTFGTKLNLSKVMPVIDVPVTFAIKRQGANYTASGPTVNPFKVGVGFPEVNPTVKVDINTMWTGAPAGSGTAEGESQGSKYAEADTGLTDNTVVSDAPSAMDLWRPGRMYAANMMPLPDLSKPVKSGYYLHYAANGPTPNDQFKGDVDMAMFGGPPVKAQFRLGYMGDNDYWIARVTIPVSPTGVPIVPPFLSLYALRGGLGYNFPISAFANDIYTAVPDMGGNYMFMAGMRVGSPDKFAYMMDGDFSVNTAGYARMDYKAWLVSTSQEGNGNFHGFFQYGDGNFDGMLAGKISLLGDIVYMEIPENAATLHFGSDYWQINAGKKEGPRLNVHMLFADTNGFFQIGTPGVAFGGGLDFNLNAGIGRIHGYLDAGISISPAPKVSGYAAGGVSAEICAFDVCVGPSIDVAVNISAPPAKASCHACVTIPIPLWNPEACGDFSL